LARCGQEEGAAPDWEPGRACGGSVRRGWPKEEGRRKRKRGKEKGKEEKKREKRKYENKKIEKGFRKLREILGRIRREVKKDFRGFFWVSQIPALIPGRR
jgi:hypothetical protein